MPTISWPGTTNGACGARSPSARWRSVRQTPHTDTATRISPGPGTGVTLSIRSSGPESIGAGLLTTQARMLGVSSSNETDSDPDRIGQSWGANSNFLVHHHHVRD